MIQRICSIAIFTCCVSATCDAGIIVNGEFSLGQFASPGDSNYVVFAPGYTGTLVIPGSQILTGWNVGLSPFDPDRSLTFGGPNHFGLEWTDSVPESGKWIDLNRGGDLWQVSQTFMTVPGQSYQLSYLSLAGNVMGGAITQIQLIGHSILTFEDTTSAIGSPRWDQTLHNFIADSSTTSLVFSAKQAGLDPLTGTQIDRVAITAVPEPSAALVIGALLSLAVFNTRRR